MPPLPNPFTPAEIASTPDLFFGRAEELKTMSGSLALGSVLIQGPVGIGKSSLLARGLDMMTGVGSDHRCDVTTATMHAEVTSADAAARVVLDSLTDIDIGKKKIRLKFGLKVGISSVEPVAEYESADVLRDYQEGRSVAALLRTLEQDHQRRRVRERQSLIIGIDEGDKAPTAIARLVRVVTTDLQQSGVRDVRFIVAGLNPLQQQLIRG